MKCKNCGQKLNDGDLFCGNCGAPVPSGHSSKKVVYIVIAVAVVLAIAAGVILALTIGSDSSDDSKPAAEIQSDTDSSKDSEADTYTGEEEDATGSSNTTGDTDSSHHADGSESEHPLPLIPRAMLITPRPWIHPNTLSILPKYQNLISGTQRSSIIM